jgi:hypothetical protein
MVLILQTHGLFILNTRKPCFTSFCFNFPYQFSPLLNLHLFILALIPLGWLHVIILTSTYSILSCGNIIFDLRPRFQEHSWCVKQGFCVL